MGYWKSIGGMIEAELTSAEIEAALAAINAKGIELFRLKRNGDLTCSFQLRRQDYMHLAALCEKRGETLRILHRNGIYWVCKGALTRPMLLAGMLILLAMALYLPSRVFFVKVEGNVSIPSRRIIAAAEECGIGFGASRREVRSEKMKNALLSAVPELQWAGVNTYGCVAVISVREGTETDIGKTGKEVTSIVASRDGYVLSGTAVRGNAVFQVGQAVKEGQVLISAYTDCGICIQATRAEGEIFAQTSRDLEAITPSTSVTRGEVQDIKRKYSLILRKNRINLWKDSGILDSTCGRMYEEYYVTLPGGFQLPIALCVETYVCYDTQVSEVPLSDAEGSLTDFAEEYILQQMVAGNILHSRKRVFSADGVYRLKGVYICSEMIGREQREQIGDTNGKSG